MTELQSKVTMYSRTLVLSALQLSTKKGGCTRLSLQRTYFLPFTEAVFWSLCLHTSQLKSYQKYSQQSEARVTERELIQFFRQKQWLNLTDPAHLQRLSKGLAAELSRPQQQRQKSPSPSHPRLSLGYLPARLLDSIKLPYFRNWEFWSLLLRLLAIRTLLLARSGLRLSRGSPSEIVLKFSHSQNSLKLRQIFLTSNWVSASLIVQPSKRGMLSLEERCFQTGSRLALSLVKTRVG